MQIKSDVYKYLTAFTKKKRVVRIPNRLMRKQKWQEEQDRKLTPNSVCIVCNFSYRAKKRGWSNNIKAICHPFREEYLSIFPKNIRLELLSESDYLDPIWMDGMSLCHSNSYKYDFFCFTIDKGQGVKCKGMYLLPLISRIAQELNMKGLILDYFGTVPKPNNVINGSTDWVVLQVRKELSRFKSIDIIRGVKSQKEISFYMSQCKYVIFPNTKDASPRTIPESILRGKPVLMNKNIWGGWKYVTETNGCFFDGAESYQEIKENEDYYYNEIKDKMLYMKEVNFNSDNIRDEFLANYGFLKTAKRMAKIINRAEGSNKYRYVAYKEFGDIMQRHCK